MTHPIPAFDHNLVLPPHRGDPRLRGDLSPYACTTVDLCERFANSPERGAILKGLLAFRKRLRGEGLKAGYQWLDGSFLEDIETSESRPPNDLDLLTVYWIQLFTHNRNAVWKGMLRIELDTPNEDAKAAEFLNETLNP